MYSYTRFHFLWQPTNLIHILLVDSQQQTHVISIFRKYVIYITCLECNWLFSAIWQICRGLFACTWQALQIQVLFLVNYFPIINICLLSESVLARFSGPKILCNLFWLNELHLHSKLEMMAKEIMTIWFITWLNFSSSHSYICSSSTIFGWNQTFYLLSHFQF